MKILVTTVLCVLSVLAFQEANASMDKVVCYFGSWSTYRHGMGKFDVEDIDPRLCTHLIYTFVGLNSDGSIRVLDPYNDLQENWGKGAFNRFNQLKQRNPNVKTIIAIGGWNEGSETYSRVMDNDVLRANFVQAALNLTLEYGFDGFDLDWEYPNQRGGKPIDVENFSRILRELRAEFDKHGLLLSSAVAAGATSAGLSYNIPEVSQYLDIINVMAYDLHGSWETQTGHNAPLYPSSHDITDSQKQLNVEACVNYWLSQGADPSKIVLGLGLYGRTFTLNDPSNNGIGAPANQPGNGGPYTNQPGMLGYNEILELQGQGGWTVVWDQEQQVPYMYKGNQWAGYDDPSSITLKVNWAKTKGLGGAMVWSVETDDFHGLSGVRFALLHAINHAIGNEIVPEIPTQPPLTSPPPTGSDGGESGNEGESGEGESGEGGSNGLCQSEGFVRDPINCAIFYQCVRDDTVAGGFRPVSFECQAGLMFDLTTSTCNYPWNVQC